ncbi:MAG: hypothetical protein ABL982_24580 [Vicinamibacterales bacterium]
MIRSILVSAVIGALSVVPVSNQCVFLPDNNLKIPIGSLEDKGITQAQFNAVMDQAEALYKPVIAARGARLVLKRLWDNNTVNASAQQQGKDWILNMYGGLARHATITQDGMALVVCHELGHHIGGAPKYDGNDWASNEGESDYFANLKCLRRMFASPAGQSFTRPKGGDEATARAGCEAAWKGESDRALCTRAAMAGMSVTSLFRVLRGQTVLPKFDTPDATVVTETQDGHPDTQCRLDTYYAGSLCTRAVGDALSETDPNAGTCSAASGHSLGLRPLCWYKPAGAPVSEPPAFAAASAKAVKTSAVADSLKNPALWTGL